MFVIPSVNKLLLLFHFQFNNFLKKAVDFWVGLVQDIPTMNEELVTYEVELDSPDFFVSFQAEKGLSLEQIEFLAIQEMTRNTRVWNVKIVE